ncbi:MAG: hypothetical protein ABI655_06010 [Phenylobacterium sp.]
MTASEALESTTTSAIRRVLQFAGGFFAGVVLVPVGILAALAVVILTTALLPSKKSGPAEPLVLTTTGADISQVGGSVIEVRSQGGQLRQACRDVCDDLRLEDQRGELEAVRVLDAQGRCITCQDLNQPYRTAPTARRWSVSGRPSLSVVGAAYE